MRINISGMCHDTSCKQNAVFAIILIPLIPSACAKREVQIAKAGAPLGRMAAVSVEPERLHVVTATQKVGVKEVEAAAKQVESIAEKSGGYVQSQSVREARKAAKPQRKAKSRSGTSKAFQKNRTDSDTASLSRETDMDLPIDKNKSWVALLHKSIGGLDEKHQAAIMKPCGRGCAEDILSLCEKMLGRKVNSVEDLITGWNLIREKRGLTGRWELEQHAARAVFRECGCPLVRSGLIELHPVQCLLLITGKNFKSSYLQRQK